MVVCPECGEEFDSEKGLEIHETVEHEEIEIEDGEGERGLLDDVIEFWRNPRNALVIGILLGVLLSGTLVLSSPDTFTPEEHPGQVGEMVLNHYRKAAPPAVNYELLGVEGAAGDVYAVKLKVERGTLSSNETVYVAGNGRLLFEHPPVELEADLSTLSK
ncbi:MAG: hypothetical protein SVQ76_01050 [Candidatus Nanohaloarchaea archaeon]|nr:hypothetical protein [Candidatus Nanohaloarchaea archaeon]